MVYDLDIPLVLAVVSEESSVGVKVLPVNNVVVLLLVNPDDVVAVPDDVTLLKDVLAVSLTELSVD